MIDIKGLKMIEIIIALIAGVAVGAGGSAVLQNIGKKEKVEPVIIKSHEGTEEAIKQLTNLDLVVPLCEPSFIESNGNNLCREIICLQFTRGLDSQTSGSQCESISNINNKIQIDEWCNQYKEATLKQNCVNLFWKRD